MYSLMEVNLQEKGKMGLSKISIWRRDGYAEKYQIIEKCILLLAYDLLVLCIVFVKNGMINISRKAILL